MSSKTSKLKTKDEICVFCNKQDLDTISFGKMFKYNKLYAHYYCLLLSSGLSQNGRDNEGMLGFLTNDIKIEVKRGEKLKCSYCKRKGATIGCSNRSCKKCFHLPCGLQNQSMHQFFGNFHSYCIKHRPKQSLEGNDTKDMNEKCVTCYLELKFDGGIEVLSTPCCHKLIHRDCLQRQAISAGYFFKCPLCNNANQFKEEMTLFGIYIPKQDASWETVNNAFGELYERHSRCDIGICLCPLGRTHVEENGIWKLFICNTCGSEGVHMRCAVISDENTIWVCDQCKQVVERANKKSQSKLMSIKSEAVVNLESDDDNDVEMIELINTPSSSKTTPNTFNNQFNRTGSRRSRIIVSTNLGQEIEINLDNKTPKLLHNNNSQIETSNKKDVDIQCVLVDKKDLIDSDPIDNYLDRNSSKKGRIIWPKNHSKEVIEIDSSDDDDCLIID